MPLMECKWERISQSESSLKEPSRVGANEGNQKMPQKCRSPAEELTRRRQILDR